MPATQRTFFTGSSSTGFSATEDYGLYFVAEGDRITNSGYGYETSAESSFHSIAGRIYSGTDYGFYHDEYYGHIHVTGTGIINGATDGIYFYYGYATLINDGIIRGRTNFGIDFAYESTSVTNNGTIRGEVAGVAFTDDDNFLLNENRIQGTDYGILVEDGANVVINNGLITGEMRGILVDGTHDSTLHNTGTIEATETGRAYEGGAGVDSISNRGTFVGNITLGDGDDSFDGRMGTVQGTVFGETGDDFLRGGNFADTLNGGGGEDLLRGGWGNDTLIGSFGDDELRGEGGNDRLEGGAGDDTLNGGLGADILLGGFASDTLDGGQGNDILTGGTQSDSFVFQRFSGRDAITDFDGSGDTINLEALEVTSYAFLATHISSSNGDAVIDLNAVGGNGTIIVENMAGQLDAGDFVL